MASQTQDDKDKPGARAYPTRSHQLLGMTHRELLADMAARGETEAEALAMFARAESSIAAILGRGKATAAQRKLIEVPAAMAFVCGLRIFDETVAAGPGMFHSADAQHRAATLADFFGKRDWDDVIVARVSGWSMKDASISDGDVVLVDTKRKAKHGDLVLAHLAGHGQMVKRLCVRFGRAVMLESANEGFDPIEIGEAALTIQGVVVGRAGKL